MSLAVAPHRIKVQALFIWTKLAVSKALSLSIDIFVSSVTNWNISFYRHFIYLLVYFYTYFASFNIIIILCVSSVLLSLVVFFVIKKKSRNSLKKPCVVFVSYKQLHENDTYKHVFCHTEPAKGGAVASHRVKRGLLDLLLQELNHCWLRNRVASCDF